jgi:hypothetical protein
MEDSAKNNASDNTEDLNNLLNYFELLCSVMKLGNWRISLDSANKKDMHYYVNSDGAWGCCNKNRNMQQASIYINTDRPQKDENDETWEHTLIHEMLHIMFDELNEYVEHKCPDLREDDLYNTIVERLLNMLSYTIYDSLEIERKLEDATSGVTSGVTVIPKTIKA